MMRTMSMNPQYAFRQTAQDVADSAQMSLTRIMSLVAMAFLWTGSQIPVYIFGMSLGSGGARRR